MLVPLPFRHIEIAPAFATSTVVKRRSLRDYPVTSLFGFPLLRGRRDDVARDLVRMAAAGDSATVHFMNAHCINTALDDRHYRAALATADHLLPDGSGIAMAASLAGVELGDNLNGTDLFPELCRHAAREGQSIYLLGGEPGIAAQAAAAMRARFPALRVAGTHHGYWSERDEPAMLDEINASGARIVLVGLGVPVQERFLARVRDRLCAPICMGVGGLFDYYSGAIPRAPEVMRRTGTEWLWRLWQEPRRLAARYLLGNPRFVGHALAHAVEARDLHARGCRLAKRAFDVAVASAALLLALPLLLAVALAIKAQDGGPAFFRQTRIGERGRPFGMWKFRSMVIDAEAKLAAIAAQSERDGVCFKMRRDPRITAVGAFIRKLSIDELPQLFNVLAGHMSLVGPRPALAREVVGYAPHERGRLAGAPGLTCTWQVSGRADIPFAEQVKLDVAYLASRSMLGDLWLLFRTVPAVIGGRGAY